MDIKIVTRDTNGKRHYIEGNSFEDAYKYIARLTDEDEIQLVLIDKICLYNGLTANEEITIEEFRGYFA